jgi:ubiquinone/menaquinone biosynthesis C-methylase UbiE
MNGLLRESVLPTNDSRVTEIPICRVSVAEGYERWAPTYDDTPNPVLALEQREVRPLIPNISGKCVVDLGCGTGRWMQILESSHPQVSVGVDASMAMLRGAESKVATRQLLHADCCALPLTDATFDFAICSFALGHIEQFDKLVHECARVLKQNATLFVTDMHPKAYGAGWNTSFRDERGRVEISAVAHDCDKVIRVSQACGLRCSGIEEFVFDEPEAPIFSSTGKMGFFSTARQIPSVVLYRFCRMN